MRQHLRLPGSPGAFHTVTLAVPMADPDVRASDDDRERTAEQLRGAAAHGRISVDELEERLQAAYGARTQGELVPLVADLPAAGERPAGGGPPPRSSPICPRRSSARPAGCPCAAARAARAG